MVDLLAVAVRRAAAPVPAAAGYFLQTNSQLQEKKNFPFMPRYRLRNIYLSQKERKREKSFRLGPFSISIALCLIRLVLDNWLCSLIPTSSTTRAGKKIFFKQRQRVRHPTAAMVICASICKERLILPLCWFFVRKRRSRRRKTYFCSARPHTHRAWMVAAII